MGLIAHPGEITDISVSSDGKFLMSSGGGDFSVNIWEI
jgi:WD40 repeat protein